VVYILQGGGKNWTSSLTLPYSLNTVWRYCATRDYFYCCVAERLLYDAERDLLRDNSVSCLRDPDRRETEKRVTEERETEKKETEKWETEMQ